MLALLTIAGGVALILFGVRFLNKGVDRLLGPALGTWMRRVAGNRRRAALAGFVVASVAPSSSMVAAMAVQSVRGGRMTPGQMLAVVLGANVGLTVAVQLIALDIWAIAPVFVLIGVALFQGTRSRRARGIGQVVLAIGFIFLAMGIISEGARDGLAGAGDGDLAALMAVAEGYPWAAAALAAVLTLALQSSKATIGLVIALMASGVVTMRLGVAAVMGVNVGLALTMLVMGWSQSEARRLAVAHLWLKLALGCVGVWGLGVIVGWADLVPGAVGTRLATVHSAFNVVLLAIGLPLVGPIMWVARVVVPRGAGSDDGVRPRHLDRFSVETPSLALSQSALEVMHVSEIVREMYRDIWQALATGDLDLSRAVARRDDDVDALNREVQGYLTRLRGDEIDGHELMIQLHYLNELETIGDIIDRNMASLVGKRARLGIRFSTEGWEELERLHTMVGESLLLADTVFMRRDKALAQELLAHKSAVNETEHALRGHHFERLTSGVSETQESTAIHLDLLASLRRISSAACRVGADVQRGEGVGKRRSG